MKKQTLWALLILILFSFASSVVTCSSDDDDATDDDDITDDDDAIDDDDDVVDDDDTAETHGFYFASTPVQAYIYEEPFYHFGDFDLGADVDIVSIHNDFYGAPLDEFSQDGVPPDFWAEQIDKIKKNTETWGKPVYLSLALISGNERKYLPGKPYKTAKGMDKEDNWSSMCFNFDTDPDAEKYKKGYFAYVKYMIEKFEPAYLTIGIEINMFQKYCDPIDPTAFDALVKVYNEAYDLAKEMRPELPVFPSFQIDDIIGINEGSECYQKQPDECIEKNLVRIKGIKRDIFAISLYPYFLELNEIEVDYSEYIELVISKVDDDKFVVAETGYISTPLIVNVGTQDAPDCHTLCEFSDERQIAYFNALVETARKWDMDFVTWWSNRDLIPVDVMTNCPCEAENNFCDALDAFRQYMGDTFEERFLAEVMFKMFGTMGIRDYYGSEKSLFSIFQKARAEERAKDRN